jgi:SAM-dependent methyltransferase
VPLDHLQFDEDYYRSNGQLGDRPALSYYTRLVRRYIGQTPVLDFGCGTGHLVRHLCDLGRADGFEVSEYSAAAARETSPGSEIYENVADIPDATYGGLTAIHVIEHVSDDVVAESLEEWRRILRPSGRALVVTPDLTGFGRALAQDGWNGFTDPTHINLKPHAEWKRTLERGGFSVQREGSDGLWNVPYGKGPKLVEAARYAVPSLTQFLSGRLFLRPGTGESSVFVVSRVD